MIRLVAVEELPRHIDYAVAERLLQPRRGIHLVFKFGPQEHAAHRFMEGQMIAEFVFHVLAQDLALVFIGFADQVDLPGQAAALQVVIRQRLR